MFCNFVPTNQNIHFFPPEKNGSMFSSLQLTFFQCLKHRNIFANQTSNIYWLNGFNIKTLTHGSSIAFQNYRDVQKRDAVAPITRQLNMDYKLEVLISQTKPHNWAEDIFCYLCCGW